MWTSGNFFAVTGSTAWSALLRLAYLWTQSVEKEQFYCSYDSGFRLSHHRGVILIALLVVLPALVVWNHVGFLLDDVFFPNWRHTEVKAPLFFVGNARSGTTWLHRILTQADDKQQVFTTLRTWELLFAVSITWRLLFSVLYEVDRWIYFGIGFRTLQYLEKRLFGHITTHPIGLMQPEEDEWLMMHIGMAQLLLFFFPTCGDLLKPLVLFDYHPDILPYIREAGSHLQSSSSNVHLQESLLNTYYFVNQQERLHMLSLSHRFDLFRYYKECVQRHLFFHMKFRQRRSSLFKPLHFLFEGYDEVLLDPVFVSKNPAFTLRIPTIYATFPDAKVTCLLRNPVESVPSMVSYISKVWHAFSDPREEYPRASELLSFCEAHYLFPLLHLHPSIRPKHSWAFVSYHHLRRDLKQTVMEMLDRLYVQDSGYDPKERLKLERLIQQHIAPNLSEAQLETKSFSSDHIYSLKHCCPGMSPEQLREALQAVYLVHKDAF